MITPISLADARAFMAAHHYIGTTPINCRDYFGGYSGGELVAVACYGHCHVPRLAGTFVELRRLAASPKMERSLSSFLADTMREMKRRGAKALVTWADPAAGHHGGIYQATNWIYCEPRSYNWNASYRMPDGKVMTHRAAFKYFGTSAKEAVLKLHPDWEAFLPPMKYRYIYPITLTKDECLDFMKARERPYPKPDVDGTRSKRPTLKMRAWS
jgi:hypothetical protein